MSGSSTDRLSVLDPDMRVIVEAAEKTPPIWTLAPAEGRALRADSRNALKQPREEVGSAEVRSIALAGRSIDISIFKPEGTATDRPGIFYIHGGGFVGGNVANAEPTCRQLVNRLGAVVVSPEYRLAPEHRYPAGLDDCFELWQWMVSNGAELGVDPSRVAVGGVSAGGNFAAAICVRAHERKLAMPIAQLLVYPVTHVTFSLDDYDPELALSLKAEAVVWFSEQYLGTTEAGRAQAEFGEVSPLLAPDLSSMPPAVIVTAQYDILRPQIEAFARRLESAGVPVTLLNYPGVVHGFFGQAPLIARAVQAVQDASEAFRTLLDS
jgi:acetyl esterase